MEELPAWRVFGLRGESVLGIMKRAEHLTGAEVAEMAAMDMGAEHQLSELAERRWRGTGNRFFGPLGQRIGLVYDAVEIAARRTDDGLFSWDPKDEVERLTDAAWISTARAAINAAIAIGAPELFSASEREIISHRWMSMVNGTS